MATISELTLRVQVDEGGRLKVLSTDLQKVSGATKQVEKTTTSTFSRMIDSIKSGIFQWGLYGAAIGAALSPVVIARFAAQFESTMSQIVGLTGTSRAQVKLWEQDLKRLGPETGKSIQELADALYFIASSGVDSSEAINILEASAKASRAGLGETKVIADLATSAINAYGVGNLSASKAVDILVAAVREGKGEAPEFANALGRVIPIAAQMDVSFDQVAAAVAAMTRQGLDAAESTTALRGILLAILSPAGQAEKALKGMGTSSAELRRTIKERGLLAALEDINELTKKYGQETIAQVFPEARALVGVLNLMGENAEDVSGIFVRLANSTGSTDKAFLAIAKDADFFWDKLKSKLNVALISLGGVILPAVVEGLEDTGDEFDRIGREIDKAVENTGAVENYKKIADEMSRIPVIGDLIAQLDFSSFQLGIKAGLDPLTQLGMQLEASNKSSEAFIRTWEQIKTDFAGVVQDLKSAWSSFLSFLESSIPGLRQVLNLASNPSVPSSGSAPAYVNLWKQQNKDMTEAQDILNDLKVGSNEYFVQGQAGAMNYMSSLDGVNSTLAGAKLNTDQVKKATEDANNTPLNLDPDKSVESLNKSMKNTIEQIRQATTALNENKFAAIEQAKAAFLAKGGNQALADEFERVSKLNLNAEQAKQFRAQLEDIVKQISKLGVTSPDALAKIDADFAKASLRAQGFNEDQIKIIDAFLMLLGIINKHNLKEELSKQFEGLDIVPAQIHNIQLQLADLVNTVLKIAATPELSQKYGIDFAKANQIIVDATQQAQKDIERIELEGEVKRLQNSDSFWDQMKGGVLDFVLQVQSNSELVSQFFADTLSQMSQNFSDLFYNVLTGKFKDLEDLAKNAFKAILRAFLDMVSAIATRQIVISIGGLFGVGGASAKAAGGGGGVDPFVLGKQAAGVVGGGMDLFGAGGAFSTIGSALGIGGAGALTPAGTLGGIPIASGASVIGSAPSGALKAPGFMATAGAAITIVGAVLGAAALAFAIISPLLQKTPRLDIDFDSVKTEAGRRAAFVSELLDDDFLKDEIINISVKRKAGLGLGGDEGIKKVLADAIQGAVNNLLDIINKLPDELARTLTDQLLATPLDIDTEVAGERLFEFDAKGKKIGEKFQQLINGEIQAKFLFAVDGFLETMLESLGVLPEKASEFIQAKFEEFKNAGSREARAAIGQELLQDLNAFVDAFNIVSGNINDSIGQTIDSVQGLSRELGFDAVPTIGALREELKKMLENAELDPETVQKYADLRNAIVQGILDIGNAISGLIGKIDSLNQTIIGFGGEGIDLGPFLDQAVTQLTDFFNANIGDLSLGEQEAFLDEIAGFANAQLAQERAAFEAQQQAARAAAEAQKSGIQARIDGLNKEKDKINEAFRKRIDALNEELRIAESFKSLTESIRDTIDSILFSPESVLTGVEQVTALQARIADMQTVLARTTDPDQQLGLAESLRDAFKSLFDAAGDAFGVNSPEFVAIFDQVTGGLSDLADLTDQRGRTAEEISASIEKLTEENKTVLEGIDAKIEAAQAQLAAIGQQTATNTFKASEDLQATFDWLRDEYIRILEERFAQLGELTDTGFATEVEGLGVIAGFAEENLTVLRSVEGETLKQTDLLQTIADRISAVKGFAGGSGGVRDFGSGTFAMLHGLEAVLTSRQIEELQEKIIKETLGNLNTMMLSSRHLDELISGPDTTSSGMLGRRGALSERGADPGTFSLEMTPSGSRRSSHGPSGELRLNINIKVDVTGATAATVEALPGNIEDTLARSIKKGGKLRNAIKEAARGVVS